MRVYLDENLSPEIAKTLRSRNIDAVSAHEVGNNALDDRAQLQYATSQGGSIVTRDVTDFPALAEDAIRANETHAGIILVPPRFPPDQLAAIADAIARIVVDYPEGLAGAVVYARRQPT